jgi:hypothetical protein
MYVSHDGVYSPTDMNSDVTRRFVGMSDAEANRSIEDIIELMSCELERLKEVLVTLRLLDAPGEQIRRHIDQIDERESELERLRKLVAH